MRAFALALLIGSTFALGACSMPGAPDNETRLETTAGERAAPAGAPTSNEAPPPPTPGSGRGAPGGSPDSPIEAPPMSDPLPPERMPDAAASNPPTVDRSCRTSADCVVKNVGNCCGAMPACVNTNARTDPAAVQAQCAREGISGVCGFKDVTACTCVAGTCQDAEGALTQ